MKIKDREKQLDVIRGFAILLAMGWHLNKVTGSPIADAILAPGRLFGWAGVDLFFVLSGFLIGGLITTEVHRTGSFDRSRFFVRRAMRLWPVLYAFVALQIVAARFPFTSFVPQIFFHVQNYWHTPIAHLWSLAVEEQFYLIAGIAMPVLAKRGVSFRSMAIGLSVIIVAVTALRTWGSIAGIEPVVLQSETQYRADALASGVLLALIYKRAPERFAQMKAAWPLWLACLAASGWVLAVYVPSDLARLRPLAGFPAALVASISILLLLHGRRVPTALSGLASVFAWLGIYSYSLYIFHVGIGGKGGAFLARRLHLDVPAARVLLGYLAAIAAAFVVTKIVERPFMALRDRLYPAARPRTEAERRVDEQKGAARASA